MIVILNFSVVGKLDSINIASNFVKPYGKGFSLYHSSQLYMLKKEELVNHLLLHYNKTKMVCLCNSRKYGVSYWTNRSRDMATWCYPEQSFGKYGETDIDKFYEKESLYSPILDTLFPSLLQLQQTELSHLNQTGISSVKPWLTKFLSQLSTSVLEIWYCRYLAVAIHYEPKFRESFRSLEQS